MQRRRIKTIIEYHNGCFMIDPQQVGFEIQGERFECQSPEQAFDQMKVKVLADIEAELEEWRGNLFPPEIEEETETEEENDEEE